MQLKQDDIIKLIFALVLIVACVILSLTEKQIPNVLLVLLGSVGNLLIGLSTGNGNE